MIEQLLLLQWTPTHIFMAPPILYGKIHILLMVVRHPETGEDVLAMSIKLIHHKGADNKPKL